MLRKLLQTPDDPLLTVLRLVLGVIFFAHGAQKALGWFGGPGFSATVASFGQGLGIPAPLAVLAILAEFLGGLGLILGLLGRIAAFGVAFNMLVAIVLVHLPNGLFMNWTGAQRGEGIEYHLLAIAAAIPVLVRGSGAFSVDHAILQGGLHRQTPHPFPSRG